MGSLPAEIRRDVREAVFTRDQDINRLLRSLRGNIVTHLSVNRNADIAACLALMSIAKDAERIGDYCKNLYEVTEHGDFGQSPSPYQERIRQIPGEVEKIFDLVRAAFQNSDTKEAKVAIKAADAVRAACDEIAHGTTGRSFHHQHAGSRFVFHANEILQANCVALGEHLDCGLRPYRRSRFSQATEAGKFRPNSILNS